MLAPLARMTLMVVAALLISFVDQTFDVSATSAGSEDARTLPMSFGGDVEESRISGASIARIDQQEGGTDLVRLHAHVDAPALNCKLTIVYENGDTDVLDDVVSDADGLCVTAFDVPDEESAVGTAQVKLEVVDDLGKLASEATRTFTVK